MMELVKPLTLVALSFTVCNITFVIVHFDVDGSGLCFIMFPHPAHLVTVRLWGQCNGYHNTSRQLRKQVEAWKKDTTLETELENIFVLFFPFIFKFTTVMILNRHQNSSIGQTG